MRVILLLVKLLLLRSRIRLRVTFASPWHSERHRDEVELDVPARHPLHELEDAMIVNMLTHP